MPKYWVKRIFTHGSFPKVDQKQKTERERTKVGNNNGQLRIATPPWVPHAKPPGPICNDLCDFMHEIDIQKYTDVRKWFIIINNFNQANLAKNLLICAFFLSCCFFSSRNYSFKFQ